MGEARRKKRQMLETLRTSQPRCIYCAEMAPTESVDHMPPIAMFAGRMRPKGLEFGACVDCNGGGRGAEQVASLIGRLFPDAVTEAEQEEIGRVFQSVSNNHPGLLNELLPKPRHHTRLRKAGDLVPDNVHPLDVSGPLVNAAMNTFSAKLGFALHRRIAERPVPIAGGVAVRWFTNFERLTGNFPEGFLDILGPPSTLVQGKLTVEDQFQFASAATPDKRMSGHFASFRESFGVVAFAADDFANLKDAPAHNLFRPGYLRGWSPNNSS